MKNGYNTTHYLKQDISDKCQGINCVKIVVIQNKNKTNITKSK